MRAALGIVVAMGLAAPLESWPALAHARAQIAAGWPVWPVIVAAVLVVAGVIMPSVPEVRRPRVDYSALAVGCLFVLEPLLHLAVLGMSAWVPTRAGAQALLPMAPPQVTPMLAANIVIFAMVVPVVEEFFFRGRLLPWLRVHLGAVSAVTISAGAFAVAHGDLTQAVIALPVGLLLGFMRVRGADLGACMLAHAVHNGLFILAGPGLIGLPVVGPILLMAGAVLISSAWFFHIRPRPSQWRHWVLTQCAVVALIVISWPWWQRQVDQLWVAGVHRLCVYWRIDTGELLARVVAQDRHSRLYAQRVELLADRLRAQPCQTTPRQTGLLALLEPDQCRQTVTWEDDSYELLDSLAVYPPPRYDDDLARRLGGCFPEAFVDTVFQRPEVLTHWLPLPAHNHDAAILLTACQSPRDRRVLLASLESAFPGQVYDVITEMMPPRISSLERRHLRRFYPDLAQRLAALAAVNLPLAEACGYVSAVP